MDETWYRTVILPTEHADETRQDGWSYGGDVDATDWSEHWRQAAADVELAEGWSWTR